MVSSILPKKQTKKFGFTTTIPQVELFSFFRRNHKLLSIFTDLYPIVYFSLESTLGCSRLLIWGLPNKAGSWQTHLSELNDEISIGAFAMDFSINFQSWNSLQLSKRSPVKKLFCWFINNKIFLWAILYSVLTVTVLYSLMNMRQLHILFNRVLNAA